MENKKRKWEIKYEEYSSSTELDERIEYLGDLINGKVATKEEFEEHKKLAAIKNNLPKVKNILDLRGKLEEQVIELKAEISKRKLIATCDKYIEKLENQMKQLEEENEKLESEMKDPKLTPEKKAEIKSKLEENQNKRQTNNRKFGEIQEEKQKNSKDAEKSKFKDITTEELENKELQLHTNISKCNLACNKLMQGYSWKSVEVALDKFENERLTAKGKNAEKMKKNRAAAKEEPEKEAEKEAEKEPEKEEEKEAEKEPEKALAKITGWQKLKNGAKAILEKIDKFLFEKDEEKPEKEENTVSETKPTVWQKIKDWFKKEEKDSEKQPEKGPEKGPEKEPIKEPIKQSKEDSFRQYLKDVAEKGIDCVEQERLEAEKAEKEARRNAAIEKLKANREGKDVGAINTNLDKQLYGQDDDGR